MKINVGIVGYGNLGKAVEELILSNKKYNLVAIFSRRNVVSKFNSNIEKYENFVNYYSKIDTMFLCGGSKSDLEIQTPEILRYFDCINTFDTHSKINTEFEKLDNLAKNYHHRLIMSCGWDPGIFSIIRVLFDSIGENEPITFWGKGISMGHSDAIRRVDGVIDGVEFTVPNKEAIKLARAGKSIKDIPHHFRDCYVVASKNDEKMIEKEIKSIPNYFLGQNTSVSFVSVNELTNLKNKISHKGEIIESFKLSSNLNFKMNFSVKMDSNPFFTAKIMLAYETAVRKLKLKQIDGAFTLLDIPISYLIDSFDRNKLLKLC